MCQGPDPDPEKIRAWRLGVVAFVASGCYQPPPALAALSSFFSSFFLSSFFLSPLAALSPAGGASAANTGLAARNATARIDARMVFMEFLLRFDGMFGCWMFDVG